MFASRLMADKIRCLRQNFHLSGNRSRKGVDAVSPPRPKSHRFTRPFGKTAHGLCFIAEGIRRADGSLENGVRYAYPAPRTKPKEDLSGTSLQFGFAFANPIIFQVPVQSSGRIIKSRYAVLYRPDGALYTICRGDFS